MASKTAKNGKIEFLRFLFSCVIILFHFSESFLDADFRLFGDITLFFKGSFGVEFFFVVSGYLMAASAYKRSATATPLGRDTAEFMGRKLMTVLPYHFLVYGVAFIGICVESNYSLLEAVQRFFNALPNFFFISRSGLPVNDILGVEWYISDMLIAMLILYPLCRKYYSVFSKIIAPVIAITFVGYMIKTTGSISGATAWSGLVSKTLLRAIASICAGAFTFELCRNLKKLNFSKTDKIVLTVVEIVSLTIVMLYMLMGNFEIKYGGHVLIFACICVCLSFSGVTYGNKAFNNRFVYFLGSLSLPLYLWQSVARKITVNCLGDMRLLYKLIIFVALTFALTFIFLPVEKRLRKAINNKIAKLKGI